MSLPFDYNNETKQVSLSEGITDEALLEEINQLNRLIKDLTSITTEVPESPEPSLQITNMLKKMIAGGVESLKKKQFKDAVTKLTLALEIQHRRTNWEHFGVQLSETNGILQARCDAYIMNKQYIEAYADADMLLSTQVNTVDNFLRKAIAELNLGKLQEAKVDLERGLCFHENDKRLADHLGLVNHAIAVENGEA
ncbi:hypothetical protein WICPIJ_004465 [Wickerhamomyces pijperi]|uniref:Translocation protein SEC72 n=1 Tax=Wickerhamomyces pijperi TaxID=599730 RepID=A0A9P8TMW6_WICPI|nr:hypothetical protein WICPIJ_004465 [Wickerhamomyces pijperi]